MRWRRQQLRCNKVLSDLDLSPPIETWLTRLAAIKSVIGVVMGMKLDGTCARSDSNRRELHTKTDINGRDQGQGRGGSGSRRKRRRVKAPQWRDPPGAVTAADHGTLRRPWRVPSRCPVQLGLLCRGTERSWSLNVCTARCRMEPDMEFDT